MNIVINNRLSSFTKLLQTHDTVSVQGMPGSGISLFLRELALADSNTGVYIDVFGLPKLTTSALLEEIRKQLKLARSKSGVTIYFAGFDQLQPVLNTELLQSLHSLARTKNVKLVFGLCVSLKKLIPDHLFDSGLRLFGNVYYLQPYDMAELRFLLDKYGPAGWQTNPKLEEYLMLSGGHFQLLLSLLEDSGLYDTPNESTQMLFKNMYGHLLGPQRTIIRRVAANVKRVEPDEYLLGVGMIKQENKACELFSPLYTGYIMSNSQNRLPAKERRLLAILKRHEGRVVPKKDIYDAVWRDEEVGSEWALNALVYRLRKHPAFTSQDYSIENQKKLGYILTKNT